MISSGNKIPTTHAHINWKDTHKTIKIDVGSILWFTMKMFEMGYS